MGPGRKRRGGRGWGKILSDGHQHPPQKVGALPERRLVGLWVFCPETYAPDDVKRAGFRKDFGARFQERPEQVRGLAEFAHVRLTNDGEAVPDPYVVVETRHGASEGLLFSRARRNQDLVVARCVAKECVLTRHDELLGAVVVGAFMYEVRHVPL